VVNLVSPTPMQVAPQFLHLCSKWSLFSILAINFPSIPTFYTFCSFFSIWLLKHWLLKHLHSIFVNDPPLPHAANKTNTQVVMAFDEACVKPAAVAISSMLSKSRQPNCIRTGIIDLGLSKRSRECLEQLVPASCPPIDWLSPEQALRSSGGAESGSYDSTPVETSSIEPLPAHTWVKLGLGYAVSHRTTRALYLDADVLVLGDVCDLWRDTR